MSDREIFDATEFLQRMRILEGQVAGASRDALFEAGEFVLAEAQKLCPVDTGALIASATGDDSHLGKGEYEIGFNTPYAAAVHERTEVAHPQGQAKYLETAMKTGLSRVNEILGREIAQRGVNG